MTLEIQRYLRDGGTLDALESTYAIKAKRHERFPNLVLFKYNQIESPFHERIVQECRGIILDERDGWRVVSRAFDKFFNDGEPNAAPIDWSTARVQEKLDGSLAVLYFYADEWHFASSGSPDAGGRIGYMERPFSSLFWAAFRAVRAEDAPARCRGWSLYFELTSPHNRVVVPHRETRLTLLGARHLATGLEIDTREASAMLDGFPHVREFSLSDPAELAATFIEMSPLEQEGYVVVDAAFNRIKVKHPGYVALHHAKDGMSFRAFVDIARSGEVPEVIAAFPEFAEQLRGIRATYEAYVADVAADYERLKNIDTQKAFALEAVKTRCSAALFSVRAKKAEDVRAFFGAQSADKIIEWLGLKLDAPQSEAA